MPPQAHEVVAVMVPLPLQGHLNQLLHLSRLFLYRGIPVHYISSASHNRQARLRLHGWDLLHAANRGRICFHDIPVIMKPKTPASPLLQTHLPPHLLSLFEEGSARLRLPVRNLIMSLASSGRKVVVINDSLMGSAVQDVVSIPNTEAYTFHSVSAFVLSLYMWELVGRPVDVNSILPAKLPSLEDCYTAEFQEFARLQYKFKSISNGTIFNCCRVIECPYLDLLGRMEAKLGRTSNIWALGPFNPVIISGKRCGQNNQRHHILKWLDKQAPNSVVYVSFGSTTSLAEDQVMEIGQGLKQGDQKFIWVLRDADKVDMFEEDTGNGRSYDAKLPDGYKESVKGKGIVVRDWAPQLEILAHPSTGGFVSHCGWNSCMESFTMGVPMGTWPIHSDQPRNATLVTEILRVGIVVKGWERRQAIVKAWEVESAVRKLISSGEGEELRKRAKDLSERLRSAVADGGVSSSEMDSFISHIRK